MRRRSRLLGDLGQRIVFRQQIKVHVGRGAHLFDLPPILIAFRRLPGQAGSEKTVGVFQVADQVDAAIMGAAHAQANGHFAVAGDHRLDVHYLHPAGQHVFQIHHDRRPGEGFLGEDAG